MTAKGWSDLVVDAVRRADRGDARQLELLGKLLEQSDEIKQLLQDAGYTGLTALEAVREALGMEPFA